MRNRLISVFLVFILFSSKAFSAASGTTIFDFLKLPKNAVQASLGSMSSFGQNPAELALVKKYNIQATHAVHFQDVTYNTFCFSAPIKQYGLSIMYYGLDYGNIKRVRELPNGDYREEGTFTAGDYCVQINAGQPISESICLGAGIKYINQDIDGSSLSSAAADLSILYLSTAYWSISGGLENIGFRVEGYNLPSSAYIGYRNGLADSFDVGFEFKAFFDGIMQLRSAIELNNNQRFFLRLAYILQLNNSNKSLGEWYKRNLSLGFGINIKEIISVDYSWLPFGDLGNTNIVSLKVEFK
ncbi:MAG: hypothetical protein LBD17_05730 [Endomicrobium sp.]|jgi:hypothetical protein|nr:hypothetical protein [Endomicrobium sp.]